MATANLLEKSAVLTSWKEIAQYMGKGVRTVQRWEQDFGLPVRRPQGSQKRAILARPRDLDAWVAYRCSSRTERRVAEQEPIPPLKTLESLNTGIEIHRQLRDNNRLLLDQVNSELNQLRNQILSLRKYC